MNQPIKSTNIKLPSFNKEIEEAIDELNLMNDESTRYILLDIFQAIYIDAYVSARKPEEL